MSAITPESGHYGRDEDVPLWAKSGTHAVQQKQPIRSARLHGRAAIAAH